MGNAPRSHEPPAEAVLAVDLEYMGKYETRGTWPRYGGIAYLGAASAGYPLTKAVSRHGWTAYFTSLVGCATAGIVVLVPPLVETRSRPWSAPTRSTG